MKKIFLSLGVIAALGAGVYVLRAVGFADAANLLDNRAVELTAQYRAQQSGDTLTETTVITKETTPAE